MNSKVEFKVGDRVLEIESGEKGNISRLCADKDAIYVRWDKDGSQGMVEVTALQRIGGEYEQDKNRMG